jgi:hypothetical protein
MRKPRILIGLAVLALLAASGCAGLNVRFVPPSDPRENLDRSLRLTYTFHYKVEGGGFFSSLFGGSSVSDPRLLYSLEEDADPETLDGFQNTGAEFDADKGTAVWQIASPRKLYGRRATFVLTGGNVEESAVTRLSFPSPGSIRDVSLFWEGNSLTFKLETEGKVYSPLFTLVTRGQVERRITTVAAGPDTYVWSYPGEIRPSEAKSPISFKIQYQDWYRRTEEENYQTTPIYIVPNVTFDRIEPLAGRPGHVEISFQAWGRTGLVTFEYSTDGKTWRRPEGISDPEPHGDAYRAVWDLGRDSLERFTGTIRLKARGGEKFLGEAEILPPKPSIAVGTVAQEDDTIRLGLSLRFVPPESLRVFAGSSARQRELRADELVRRTADELVFRHGDLPREPDGRLTIFISARNARDECSVEKVIPLWSVRILVARQAGGLLEVEYGTTPPGREAELEWKDPESGRFVPARSVNRTRGMLTWEFLRDLGERILPAQLNLRVFLRRGQSRISTETEVSPLAAVLGEPRRFGRGTFIIPCRVFGQPDWIKFSYSLDGTTYTTAKQARFVPAKNEIRWDLWSDLRKSAYSGRLVRFRVTLKNRYGYASFLARNIRPLYVRILETTQKGQLVTVAFDGAEEIDRFAFFYTFANRGEFKPLPTVRQTRASFTFDLRQLGRDYSNFVRIRVVGTTPKGEEVSDEDTVRLLAGFKPSSAAWHGRLLWVSFTVGWKVSEDDVRFRCAAQGRWDESLTATTPLKRVFDVNHRACAWDVYHDMVRLGVFNLDDIALRIDINDPDKGEFYSVIGFDRLPRPPLRLEETTVEVRGSKLAFAFSRLGRPASLPVYSVKDYKIEADYLSPETGKFLAARRAAGKLEPGVFLWYRKQSLDPVRSGTWVRLLVSLRNNPQMVGFALFRVRLEEDHPFFEDEEY